jgi:ZIP family zinc transporter
MAAAFGWGLLAASSLALGAIVAIRFPIGARTIVLIRASGQACSLMPEAYEHGGKLVGVVTTLGFVVAFAIHILN